MRSLARAPHLYSIGVSGGVDVDNDFGVLLQHMHGEERSEGRDNDWGQSVVKNLIFDLFKCRCVQTVPDSH